MKKLLLFSILIGFINTALATTTNNTLGAAVDALHVYKITCSKNQFGSNSKFSVSIKSGKPGFSVSAEIIKDNKVFKITDNSGGDNIYSPITYIQQGMDGIYKVLVNKSQKGALPYSLVTNCGNGLEIENSQSKPKLISNDFVTSKIISALTSPCPDKIRCNPKGGEKKVLIYCVPCP